MSCFLSGQISAGVCARTEIIAIAAKITTTTTTATMIFFIFMGIKMATDGVLRGLGIMRPFLIANMVNLAIRLSLALICAPRFGIDFVWLAVPAGWLANFLVSYAALRKSWPGEKVEPSRIFS